MPPYVAMILKAVTVVTLTTLLFGQANAIENKACANYDQNKAFLDNQVANYPMAGHVCQRFCQQKDIESGLKKGNVHCCQISKMICSWTSYKVEEGISPESVLVDSESSKACVKDIYDNNVIELKNTLSLINDLTKEQTRLDEEIESTEKCLQEDEANRKDIEKQKQGVADLKEKLENLERKIENRTDLCAKLEIINKELNEAKVHFSEYEKQLENLNKSEEISCKTKPEIKIFKESMNEAKRACEEYEKKILQIEKYSIELEEFNIDKNTTNEQYDESVIELDQQMVHLKKIEENLYGSKEYQCRLEEIQNCMKVLQKKREELELENKKHKKLQEAFDDEEKRLKDSKDQSDSSAKTQEEIKSTEKKLGMRKSVLEAKTNDLNKIQEEIVLLYKNIEELEQENQKEENCGYWKKTRKPQI